MNGPKRPQFLDTRERMERALLSIGSDVRPKEEVDAILRRRAELLARPVESETREAVDTIVIFRLGSGRYGVPLASVSEVVPRPRVVPAPGAPEEIAGLIQVRGEIRVVWNLRRLLGLEVLPESGEHQTALLLRIASGEAGVLVDEVEDIRTVHETERRPAPENSREGTWMTDDLIVVLNTEGLLPEAQ